MHHIIYLSRATQELSPQELVNLLLQARRKNEHAGITGALVYGGGQFMQVMEGEETAVQALYEQISSDPRHQFVFKMADKAIAARTFADWSMAFRELSPEQTAELQGYVSPGQWEQIALENNTADALLLRHMREIVLDRGF